MKKLFIIFSIMFMFVVGIGSVYAVNAEGSGGAAGENLNCEDYKDLTKDAWFIIRIAVPTLLVIFGAIDMGKAVMAADEKEVKKATETFVKRIVIGIAIFLLPTVIDLIMGLINGVGLTGCL